MTFGASELTTTGPYLRLARGLVCVNSDEGIAIRSDAGVILLAGDDARFVVNTVFPLLDGTRTETDLLARLADIASADLTGLLQALREHDLLLEGPGQDGTLDAAAQRLSRLAAATVVILGHTPWVTRAVDSIRAAGVGTVRHGPRPAEGCDIAIGIFPDGDASEVRDFARTMQQAAIPSLTCIIGASEALIGPFLTSQPAGIARACACAPTPNGAIMPKPKVATRNTSVRQPARSLTCIWRGRRATRSASAATAPHS